MNDVLNQVFLAVATPLILYLAALARAWVRKRLAVLDGVLDAQARAGIEAAFDTVIEAAVARGQTLTLQEIIDYARTFNPGDLARFPQLTGTDLERRVRKAAARRGLQL